jgi:hypothetical protein
MLRHDLRSTGGNRRKVKYLLGEVTEGIRALARLANWVDYGKADGPWAKDGVDAYDRLRNALDAAIRTAFLRGEPPSWLMRRRVSNAALALRASWELGRLTKRNDAVSELACDSD